jgi:predicted ATPase
MSIKNLDIQNFRGFRHFQMTDLGRVNLVVGTNNCGKTTVLEAVNILAGGGNLAAIWSILNARGEVIWVENDDPSNALSRQYEIGRFFREHEIAVGASFQLSGAADVGRIEMVARIEDFPPTQSQPSQFTFPGIETSEEFLPLPTLSLNWSNGGSQEIHIPIGPQGAVSAEVSRFATRSAPGNGSPLRFVRAPSLNAESIAARFDDIVLTQEEDLVTQALKIIEPSIQRIASTGSERIRSNGRYAARGGIFVRLKGVKDRIPIGSMGDGIWRMLGLALNLVHCANGILLVDEIDTGLHHTVMTEMWRFLYEAAKLYNVQVFATTHSRDCYQSLAAVCRDVVAEKSDITIQRIERGREEAVAYTEQEIIAAAEHDIEVR